MDVAVIGCGKFGKNHVRILKELGHQVYVYDSDGDKAHEIQKEFNVMDLDLSDMSVLNAVFIVTPSNTHYDLVKHWLRKRKHVFCEKPLCFESSQALELIDLAEHMNVLFAVGHVFRFTDGAALFKELLDIVKPHHIEMKFNNDKPPRTDSDVLFNLAIHFIDLLDMVALGKPIIDNYSKEENYGNISMRYPRINSSPITVDIRVSCNSKKERSIRLVSDNCNIKIDLMKTSNEPLKDELNHFVTCISENVNPANYVDVRVIKFLESLK